MGCGQFRANCKPWGGLKGARRSPRAGPADSGETWMAPGRVRRCHTDTGPWGFSHCTQHRLRGTQGGWPGPASDSAGGCGAMGCAFVKNPAGPPCAGHLTSPASLQGWGCPAFLRSRASLLAGCSGLGSRPVPTSQLSDLAETAFPLSLSPPAQRGGGLHEDSGRGVRRTRKPEPPKSRTEP